MKKHQLLKKAFTDYPAGVKFIQLADKSEIISSGKFSITHGGGCFGITDDVNSNAVYSSDTKTWAKIVSDKIAVRVENELEFRALMEFYKNKGWISLGGNDPDFVSYNPDEKYWSFNDNFGSSGEQFRIDKGFEIKSFPDIAKEHGLKVPLLISEDGVLLYEGDNYTAAYFTSTTGWILGCVDAKLFCVSSALTDQLKTKAFSTREAAEKWIEANNPKEKEIQLYFGLNAKINVDNGEVHVFCKENLLAKLSTGDIKDIHCAINDLENA